MNGKWITPKWMKKYVKYIIVRDEHPLEFFFNHPPIRFLEDPHMLVECSRIRAQIKLLEKLHKKGII